MTLLKHGDAFDRAYFFYALKGWESYLKGQTSGSGIPHVDKEVLGKLIVLRFDKPEQTKIAEILSTVDRAIEQTEALIAKQQHLKTGLMQDLLTRGIDEHGDLRSEQTHQFKDSPLGRIPVEWEVNTIEKLVEGKIISDVQDGNHGEMHPKSRDFVDEGIPFIMASDIADDFINVERAKKITPEQYRRLRIGFSKPGDVLLSHKASIGFVALVSSTLPEIMLTPQVTYYRVGRREALDPEYLAQFFRSPRFQVALKGLAKQSTRDYIGILAQQKLHVTYPNRLPEQELICTTLRSQDAHIRDLQNLQQKHRFLKTALMQDLLTGRKRVTELLDETEAAA